MDELTLEERMAEIRIKMLTLMAEKPMTVAECADIIGIDTRKLYTHVVALESPTHRVKYLQRQTYQAMYKGRMRPVYIALSTDYIIPEKIYKELPKSNIEGGRYIRFDINTTESIALAKHLKETQELRNSQRVKQNVWTGSTAAML